MKIITLTPVRNEEWILDSFLKNVSSFSDHVIIADQNSTDRSRQIALSFPKVTLIENNEEGHSNKVRWQLLEEARKIPGNNLIICLDADEAIPLSFFQDMESFVKKMKPGEWISFEWIQLWKSFREYRADGVWKDSWKPIAFLDDRKLNYKKDMIINDHTNRIPGENNNLTIRATAPLLHFQFVPWNRVQIKQAWYRMNELIASPKNFRRINHTYSITLDSKDEILKATDPSWLSNLSLPEHIEFLSSSWHYEEILRWFDEYGIEFFEPLQIWHIKALRDIFMERVGRNPVPTVYPSFIIRLNNIKNNLRQKLCSIISKP